MTLFIVLALIVIAIALYAWFKSDEWIAAALGIDERPVSDDEYDPDLFV